MTNHPMDHANMNTFIKDSINQYFFSNHMIIFQKSFRFIDPHKIRRENQQDVQLKIPQDGKSIVVFDWQRSTFKVFRILLKLLTNSSSYLSFFHSFFLIFASLLSNSYNILKKDPHKHQRHVLLVDLHDLQHDHQLEHLLQHQQLHLLQHLLQHQQQLQHKLQH